MKSLQHLVTAVCALLLIGGYHHAQAQSLMIFPGPHTISGDKDDGDLEGLLTVVNQSASRIDVKVKMVIEGAEEGHEPSFCWDQCFPPFVEESGIVTIDPFGASDFFSAHVYPNGIMGQTRLRFDFIIVDKPGDVASATFVFDTEGSTVSVDDENGVSSDVLLSSYPSPAVEVVNLNYTIPFNHYSSAYLSVYNVFGKEIAALPLGESRGTSRLNVASFTPGVYFYAVVVDDKRVASKKFVVKR